MVRVLDTRCCQLTVCEQEGLDGILSMSVSTCTVDAVIVRQTPDGEILEQVRITNDPVALACAIEKAGRDPEVVLEATYGWYWAVDLLQAAVPECTWHPLRVKGLPIGG
jgi:hypothetical protein